MSFGTVFRDTFRLYLKEWPVFFVALLALGAIVTLPLMILFYSELVAISPFDPTPAPPVFDPLGDPPVIFGGLLLAILAFIILSIIVEGALTYFAAERYRGQRVSLAAALGRTLSKLLSLLGASILLGLTLAAVLIPAIFATIALSLVGAGPLGALILLGAIVVLVYIWVAFSLFTPAILVEGKGSVEGLGRSWELTKGRRLPLFGVYLVLTIMAWVVSLALITPAIVSKNPLVLVISQTMAYGVTGSWALIAAAVAHQLLSGPPLSHPYQGPGAGALPQSVPPPPGPIQPEGTQRYNPGLDDAPGEG
jgi:hypothetical protein